MNAATQADKTVFLSSSPRMMGALSPLKLLGLGLLCLGSLIVLSLLPLALVGPPAVLAAAIASLFFCGLIVCYAKFDTSKKTTFPIAIYCSWFLIVSEQFFIRKGVSDADLSGKFAADAYGECAIWMVLFLAICLVIFRRGVPSIALRKVKWLLLLAVVSIGSCAYSPAPMFSLAWAAKLFVSVLILLVISIDMNSVSRETLFWKSWFWAYAVLVCASLASTFTHLDTMFGWRGFQGDEPPEFRLNTNVHPVDLAQHAAILVILGLTLHALDGRRSRRIFVVLGAVVMVLAVGKAAIVSCVFAALLFFVLQGRFKAGAGWLLGVFGIAILAFLLTPISSYFRSYQDSESAQSLTGRTELWQLALPAIAERPILGHGFMASKFIAEAADLDWDAGHLHNAFLEAAYNNGAIGLFLVLAINICIVRNTWMVLRHSHNARFRTLASGSLALYSLLLLNAFVEPVFGGRPSCTFLIFQGLLVLTHALRESALLKESEGQEAILRNRPPLEPTSLCPKYS
jgi:O-antigen ligase